MTSYNGEKFIKKQIKSIIGQTYKNWRLIICDDGSKDSTIQIINNFTQEDKRISLIYNKSHYHGAYENFWYLINYVRNSKIQDDLYLFCDQDDIWNKNKLQKLYEENKKHKKNNPILFYSDVSIIDDKDNITEKSLDNIMGLSFESKYQPFFSNSNALGCTIAVNFKAFYGVPLIENSDNYIYLIYHDAWFVKYCSFVGQVYFLKDPLVYYRRWEGNVTTKNQFKMDIFSVIKKSLNNYTEIINTHSYMYYSSLRMLKIISEDYENKKEAKLLYNLIYNGGFRTIRFMLKNRIKRKQRMRTVALYSIMLFKMYRMKLLTLL